MGIPDFAPLFDAIRVVLLVAALTTPLAVGAVIGLLLLLVFGAQTAAIVVTSIAAVAGLSSMLALRRVLRL